MTQPTTLNSFWFSRTERAERVTSHSSQTFLLLNFPTKHEEFFFFFFKSSSTHVWGYHGICGGDIPRINPGTGFPSGPRIPCRAPGTVKRRRVSVLQRASHIKEPPLWRWCWLPDRHLTQPHPRARSRRPVTPLFVTEARHTFKEYKQSTTKANTGQRGCP